ncbi:MAG: tetratricopeptide repeat protein, partial [bacterium]
YKMLRGIKFTKKRIRVKKMLTGQTYKYSAIILISAAILVFVGCTRELKDTDSRLQQPFSFNRVPALSAAPDSKTEGESGQVSSSKVEILEENPGGELVTAESEKQPEDPKITSLLDTGRAAILAGKMDDAIKAFNQVLEIDSKNTKALYNLGFIYRMKKDWFHAVDYSRRAVNSNPDQFLVHQNLAYALEGQGDIDGAINEFEEELRRHPKEKRLASMANRLATIYLSKGLTQEAFDAAHRAVELDPSQAANHATLAEVHFLNKAYTQAADSFRAALKLDPTSLSLKVRLADSLWESGSKDEARKLYEEAIAKDPSIKDQIDPERLKAASVEKTDSADSPL